MWDARGMARKKYNPSIQSNSQYRWKSPNKSWTSSVYHQTKSTYSYRRKPATPLFAKNVSKNPYKVIKKDVRFISKTSTHPSTSYYGKRYFPSTKKSSHTKFYSPNLQPSSSYPSTSASHQPGYYTGIAGNKKFPRLLQQPSKNSKTKWVRRTSLKGNNEQGSSVNNMALNQTISKPATQNVMQPTVVTGKSSYVQMQARQALKRSRRQKIMKVKKMKVTKTYCIYFNRFGKCNRGDRCQYTHDPSRVALCTRFLAGKCRMENCPFSHELAKTKVPLCNFFLRGNCNSENCPYLHVFVGKDAPICKEFATTGFCPKAESCRELHMRLCPQFYEDGDCPKGDKCELPHKRKNKTKKQIIAERKIAKRQEMEKANREECQIIPKLSITVAKEEEENDELLLPTVPKLLLAGSNRLTQNKNLSLVAQETPSTSSSDSSDPFNLPDSELRTVPRLKTVKTRRRRQPITSTSVTTENASKTL